MENENDPTKPSFYEVAMNQMRKNELNSYLSKYRNIHDKANSYVRMIDVYIQESINLFGADQFLAFVRSESDKKEFWERFRSMIKTKISTLKKQLNSNEAVFENIQEDLYKLQKLLNDNELPRKPISINEFIKQNYSNNFDSIKILENRLIITVIGRRGAGKSSFINSFRNINPFEDSECEIAESDDVECTFETKYYPYEKYESNEQFKVYLLDFPGVGTENFPCETYVEMLLKFNTDILIYLYSYNFDELDSNIVKEIKSKNSEIPIFLVRNKTDIDFESHIRMEDPDKRLEDLNDKEINECVDKYFPQFKQKLDATLDTKIFNKLYLVSSYYMYRDYFEFDELIKDVLICMPEPKLKKLWQGTKNIFKSINKKFKFENFKKNINFNFNNLYKILELNK